MKIQSDPDLHLTYCLNIHPGEGLRDVLAAIETYAVPVKDRVSAGKPFGLGLRLGARAVDELDAAAMAELKDLLQRQNMYVFTINGFPYGGFHGERVKENVYAPDWSKSERRVYTGRLVAVLGALLPDGVEGSISTVPVSYATWVGDEAALDQSVRQLMAVVRDCVHLEQESGRKVSVALEPEPDCYLQTTEGVIRFFNDHLLTRGVQMMMADTGMSEGDSEVAVRRHLGVCFDTCHAAVQFEDPLEALASLEFEGISVPKVQLSSAIRTVLSAETRQALRGFIDSVYLHQTRVCGGDGVVQSYGDLDGSLLDSLADGVEVRTHFHVPLWFESEDGLSGTSGDLSGRFFEIIKGGDVAHVEAETYTFDVLPEDMRETDVADSIVRELEWVLAKLT